MLEIILIVYLAKKIGAKVEEKGYKKGGYIFMFVAFWILGEFLGAILGAIATGEEGMTIYLFALVGAAVGAFLSFAIVGGLNQKEPLIVPRDNSEKIKW